MLYLYKPTMHFLNSNLLYISCKYNKRPIIISSKYPYRLFSATTLNMLCI